MRDRSDRYQVQTVPNLATAKRLGAYLLEAGLLTPAQVDVALNDQQATGMRFGEILAARGWVKQQTIEYLMKKIVIPERRALQKQPNQAPQTAVTPMHSREQKPSFEAQNSFNRQEVPVSKPLPSTPATGDEVSWVG